MKNRFRSQLKTTTVKISEAVEYEFDEAGNVVGQTPAEGTPLETAYEFEIKYMGHGAIVRRVMAYDGLDIVIEDLVDSLMKLPSIQRMMQQSKDKKGFDKAAAALAVMDDLNKSSISIGGMVSRIITKAPDLIVDIMGDSVVLEGNETVGDFIDWFDTLTIPQIIEALLQWYTFNFVGGLRPLLVEVGKIFGIKAPTSKTKREDDTAGSDLIENAPATTMQVIAKARFGRPAA